MKVSARIILVTAWLFVAIGLIGSEVDKSTWEQAPELKLEEMLQGPDASSVSLDSLKGKVVVLEFWATWCGPCLGAIPKIKELGEQLEGRAIQFIAITDEPESTVAPFLEKTDMHGWVGLDTDRSVFDAYAVSGIPCTVIIDKEGKVAGITHPGRLKLEQLEAVLDDKESGLPRPLLEEVRARNTEAKRKQEETLFEISIKRSKNKYGGSRHGNGILESEGSTLTDILPVVYGTSRARIAIEADLTEECFDFVVKYPADHETAMREFRSVVETTFGLKVKRVQRQREVLILSANSLATKLLQESSEGPLGKRWEGTDGGCEFYSFSTEELASRFLEHVLGQAVINETNLTKAYDFTIKWGKESSQDPEVMARLLKEQLGLELKPAQRVIEVLVVEAAEPETAPLNGK